MKTEIKLYDRLPDETESQWLAFKYYRDLGSGRSLAAAVSLYRKAKGSKGKGHPRQFSEWRLTYHWDDRVREYDLDLEAIERDRLEDSIGKELADGIDDYRKNTLASAALDLNAARLSRSIVLREMLKLYELESFDTGDIQRLKMLSDIAVLATKVSASYANQTERAYHIRLVLDEMQCELKSE